MRASMISREDALHALDATEVSLMPASLHY
jgi:hypothetical protein